MKYIFVSSTFKDMHYERDLLQKKAAPLINQEAAKYGEQVAFCDLRWGVNTGDAVELDHTGEESTEDRLKRFEEAQNRKVLSVCLDEIARNRYYFIGLVGDRYGWVPDRALMDWIVDSQQFELPEEERDISVTALEMEYGALSEYGKQAAERAKTREVSLFYFRQIDCGPGDLLPPYYTMDRETEQDGILRMNQLKEKIRDRIPGDQIHSYHMRWKPSGDDPEGGYLEDPGDAFLNQVVSDVLKLLREEWKEREKETPSEREVTSHWKRCEELSGRFRGREALRKSCMNTLKQEGRLILVSPSGSGKSALVSALMKDLSAEDHTTVLPLYCGSTDHADTILDLVTLLAQYLKEHYRLETGAAPEIEASSVLTERLEALDAALTAFHSAAPGQRLVLALDALDELTDLEDDRTKRPEVFRYLRGLPEWISLVLSSTSEEFLENVFQPNATIGKLKNEEPEKIFRAILKDSGRELEDRVVRVVFRTIDGEAAGEPLYLSMLAQRLALMDKANFFQIDRRTGKQREELRASGINLGYEMAMAPMDSIYIEMQELIRKVKNLESLVGELIGSADDIFNDPEAGDSGKSHFLRKAMRWIAYSRHGLRVTDLEGLLKQYGEPADWDGIHLKFAILTGYLREFFVIREDGRCDFAHKQLRQLAQDPVRDDLIRYEMHERLGKWFERICFAGKTPDPVALSECVYQYGKAQDYAPHPILVGGGVDVPGIVGSIYRFIAKAKRRGADLSEAARDFLELARYTLPSNTNMELPYIFYSVSAFFADEYFEYFETMMEKGLITKNEIRIMFWNVMVVSCPRRGISAVSLVMGVKVLGWIAVRLDPDDEEGEDGWLFEEDQDGDYILSRQTPGKGVLAGTEQSVSYLLDCLEKTELPAKEEIRIFLSAVLRRGLACGTAECSAIVANFYLMIRRYSDDYHPLLFLEYPYDCEYLSAKLTPELAAICAAKRKESGSVPETRETRLVDEGYRRSSDIKCGFRLIQVERLIGDKAMQEKRADAFFENYCIRDASYSAQENRALIMGLGEILSTDGISPDKKEQALKRIISWYAAGEQDHSLTEEDHRAFVKVILKAGNRVLADSTTAAAVERAISSFSAGVHRQEALLSRVVLLEQRAGATESLQEELQLLEESDALLEELMQSRPGSYLKDRQIQNRITRGKLFLREGEMPGAEEQFLSALHMTEAFMREPGFNRRFQWRYLELQDKLSAMDTGKSDLQSALARQWASLMLMVNEGWDFGSYLGEMLRQLEKVGSLLDARKKQRKTEALKTDSGASAADGAAEGAEGRERIHTRFVEQCILVAERALRYLKKEGEEQAVVKKNEVEKLLAMAQMHLQLVLREIGWLDPKSKAVEMQRYEGMYRKIRRLRAKIAKT